MTSGGGGLHGGGGFCPTLLRLLFFDALICVPFPDFFGSPQDRLLIEFKNGFLFVGVGVHQD